MDLRRQNVEGHGPHRDDVGEGADALEKDAQFVRRGRSEEQRAVEIFQQTQVLALVEGVDVVDDRKRAAVEHVPERFARDQHRAADQKADLAAAQALEHRPPFAGRDAAVHLAHPEARAFEPLAEIGAVLTDEVARRRDQADVTAGAQRFADGDAQHDFGFARARRGFEQELELAAGEPAADRRDRILLIVGERELFAGLNELVGERDGLRILLDLIPNGARRAG